VGSRKDDLLVRPASEPRSAKPMVEIGLLVVWFWICLSVVVTGASFADVQISVKWDLCMYLLGHVLIDYNISIRI
jgi:hypothetical protein